ncbi:MAG: PEP-CTERM sorting domain-containing protein [Gammaproteobacteria bacterium]|jgi:hypothetical protein
MIKLSTIAAAAALSLGVAGTANAIPMLEITGSPTTDGVSPTPTSSPTGNSWTHVGGAPSSANAEAIGDPGGSVYPIADSVPPGPGLPTVQGGWPDTASFAPDTFGYAAPGTTCTAGVDCPRGITGYDASYLRLTEGATVTFQNMGQGDATDHNVFQVWDPTSGATGAWLTIFDNKSSDNCGASGSSVPTITCTNPGSSVRIYFDAGLIAFRDVNLTTTGAIGETQLLCPAGCATNDGSNNHSPDKDGLAGYFLGMDPYLTSTQYDTVGRATYIGFTDRGCTGTTCDHDYEDLVVRASVPEPGTIFLLGAGLLGVGVGRRKLARND